MHEIEYLNSNKVWIIYSMYDGVYLLKENKTEIVELCYGLRIRKKFSLKYLLLIFLGSLTRKQPLVKYTLDSPVIFYPECNIKTVLKNKTINAISPIRWYEENVKWFYTHSL